MINMNDKLIKICDQKKKYYVVVVSELIKLTCAWTKQIYALPIKNKLNVFSIQPRSIY